MTDQTAGAPGSQDAARQAGSDEITRPIEQCVQTIFPTPLAAYSWPDSEGLNRALADVVFAEEKRSPSLGRSNVGGWHSSNDFFNLPDPALERLRARVRSMILALTGAVMKPGQHRYSVVGWANVLRTGQYNSIHVHPNSTWSGVYYVTGNPPPADDAPNPGYSGKIEFIDPRPGASATYAVDNTMQQRVMMNPDAGTMIVFPSWLQHQVHPYFGRETRISIAFNVTVTDPNG
ncbi:MAG: TIGR02466 family protein [Pseudomonadota bacterium]